MPNNTGPMTQDNMVERVACPDCEHAWAAPPALPRNADPSKMLDAFYSAIPEQFGTCPERYGIGSHGTVAAAIPLCENDLMWLRGIRAAIATMHGSDSGALREALVEARDLLNRYRQETPLGHQPHMIAHKADATLAKIDAALNLSSETGEPQ